MALNVKVIGNSGGSVATSNQTKALSFVSSLAGFFGLPYTYSKGKLRVESLLSGCLPAFLAVVLVNKAVAG